MMKNNPKKSWWKIIGLIWILLECSLTTGTVFGFVSLFSVLPRYGIYESECEFISDNTTNVTKDCSGQIQKYQLAYALGLGFYNLPAVVVGVINDRFGPRFLKLVAIIFYLIAWLSLGFVAPGRDSLVLVHTIFSSLSGICTILSSITISTHFTKRRGLVTSLISSAKLTGPIWFAVFQILINKEIVSLSTLSFIWTSFSVPMFGSAMLFLDWRFSFINSTLKSKSIEQEVKTITSTDTLRQHLTNPLFIIITLFVSFLLLAVSYLPIVWYPWLMYLTGNNLELTNRYTFIYNMTATFGIIIAPLCGFIIDYKASRGYTQKMLNISILQTFTWIGIVALCIVCMFQSIAAALTALGILLITRAMLIAGNQALIATVFPSQFIGSLLGVMWTTVGTVSFTTYGLASLAADPRYIWHGWVIILILCVIMSGHLVQSKKKSCLKIIGLIWLFIECNLVSGNIFGFASLFSILPRYGIYESKCQPISNDVNAGNKDCSGQIAEYQLAFALGIAFYNLLAVVVGVVNDYFGPRFLKLVAIVFHVISWLALGFAAPGRDWLISVHTIFVSLTGMCIVLASLCMSVHFTKHPGLVTSLLTGAKLAGSIWYAIFQILIDKEIVSLSTLSFIWASFAVPMLGSSMLFLDWRFSCLDSTLKIKSTKQEVKSTVSKDTLTQHLINPLFIVVTLFVSFLLLTITYLPVVWFPWVMYLTENNLELTKQYTFLYNMSATLSIIVAPLCGIIIDYKASRGYTQKMLNISILQTFTWITSIALCIVCMFSSVAVAIAALIILLFPRTMLVAGSQALIVATFPPQFIGSLLGIMWTVVGIISFTTYGLARLAGNPRYVWRGWAIILFLCIIMSGHLIQVWMLYSKSKKQKKTQEKSIHEEEMTTLNDN